jgi:hypothetical protein
MSINTENKQKDEEKIQKLKSFIEEIELQLTLGKSELIEELEHQKKNLISFINEQKGKVNIEEKTEMLKTFFEELQLQLALGKAETKDILEEQRDVILNKIDSIEQIIRTYEKNLEQKHETFIEGFGFKTGRLINLMEITRLEFALGKADLKDEIEEKKKEVGNKLHSFIIDLENNAGPIEAKLKKIKEDLKAIFIGFSTGLKK